MLDGLVQAIEHFKSKLCNCGQPLTRSACTMGRRELQEIGICSAAALLRLCRFSVLMISNPGERASRKSRAGFPGVSKSGLFMLRST